VWEGDQVAWAGNRSRPGGLSNHGSGGSRDASVPWNQQPFLAAKCVGEPSSMTQGLTGGVGSPG